MGPGVVGDEGGCSVLEFGPLCAGYYTIAWTGHNNNTKVSLIPPDQCGEKIIRWWATIKQSTVEPQFLAGKVNPSDGLSRNPEDRDRVLAKRARLMRDPAALEKEFDKEDFEDVAVVGSLSRAGALERTHRQLQLAGDDGAATRVGAKEDMLGERPERVVRCLVVPAWEAMAPTVTREEFRNALVAADGLSEVPLRLEVNVANHPIQDKEGYGAWFIIKRTGAGDRSEVVEGCRADRRGGTVAPGSARTTGGGVGAWPGRLGP